MLEIRQLRYFVAAAEELNFHRAAERVFLSQPALSQQIARLEAKLRTQLFLRRNRRVELTEAGRVLLEEARGVLVAVDRATQRLRRLTESRDQRYRVGIPENLILDLLPLVEAYRRSHPGIELEILEMDTPVQVAALKAQQIDLGLAGLPIQDAQIATQPIAQIPFMLVVPEAHTLALEPFVPLSSLSDVPFILMPRSALPPLYDRMVEVFAEAGFKPRVAKEAYRFQHVTSLVAAGVGLNLCIGSYRHVPRPGVVFKELEPPAPALQVVAAWRKEDPPGMLEGFLASIA